MAVFGGLCEHILRTGATSLAAELFAVRGVIDYAHLSAAEATCGGDLQRLRGKESPENGGKPITLPRGLPSTVVRGTGAQSAPGSR